MTHALMPSQNSTPSKTSPKVSWFERLMAVIALIDLILVLFDLSYVPWRDFYFRNFPSLTQVYDPIKGIEPHRETQKYLNTLKQLENQVVQTGLDSPEASQLLKTMQQESVEMVNLNPFAVANKSGTLEKIKDRMRRRIPNPEDSAKKAFSTFWSQEYLTQKGWKSEINWFDRNITPLIATNYYRSLGENGEFTNHFWIVDLPFIAIFGVEFLTRTLFISRRYKNLTWRDAMLWRWYDLFLLLPCWRWLRAIPVLIRLDQVQLLNLASIRTQISRGLVVGIAQEMTEAVVVQILSQIQDAINSGELAKRLFPSQKQRYLDINNVNELEAIASRLVQVTVYKVLPQLQPDIEALVRHSLETTLKQSPAYQGFQQIPGLGDLSTRLAEQLVVEFSKLATSGPQTAYETIKTVMEDPVGTQLSNQLVQHFGQVLGAELQQQQTLQEIQLLLSDLVEEVKINYVKRLSEEDFAAILAGSQQAQSLAPPHSA